MTATVYARPEPWLERVVAELCEGLELGKRTVARLLGMAESTLRSWCTSACRFVVPARGRPPLLADRLQRNDILGAIHASKGRISVRELKAAYPTVGRAQLRHLVQRYRRLQRKAHRRGLATLYWHAPGSVWAMDHTELPVEDYGRHLLVVRDLASGKTLASEPVRSADAASTVWVLERLFAEHGAPLVLKSDNGSAFTAKETKELLNSAGVLALYSPPGTPAYNGSCEAGVGSVKHRALEAAWQRGPAAAVSLDDLAHARSQADRQPVDRRAGSPRRVDVWRDRQPLTRELRAALHDRVAHLRARARREQGIACETRLSHAEQASLDRFAIGLALRNLDLLTVTWRR